MDAQGIEGTGTTTTNVMLSLGPAIQRLVDVVQLWAEDRTPKDWAERAVVAALHRAFPEGSHHKGTCNCEDPDSCDECPTLEAIEAFCRESDAEVEANTRPRPVDEVETWVEGDPR